LTLLSNILDENHFYVKHDSGSLTITPLNANYESALNFNLNIKDFDAALIRIINDDFVIIKNDFEINEDLKVDIDDSIIDAKGKYIYIVYFKGKELFCENCIIDKTSDNIDISKSKIYQKEGDDNYIQNDPNIIMTMNKNNLPFFKINLYSTNDNLIILDENVKLDINLKTASGNSLEIKTKYNSNGNIYVYLTESGRKTYWNLDPMTQIVLSISYSNSIYQANYYILDHMDFYQNFLHIIVCI